MTRRASSFERGDIVYVPLNPTVGKELQGDMRPALVLTAKAFNALGTALIAPITQGGDVARYAGFAVTLMASGTKTQGVVLVSAIRVVDLVERGASVIETAPDYVVQDALMRLAAMTE